MENTKQNYCDCNKNYGNKDLQGSHDIDCNYKKNLYQAIEKLIELKKALKIAMLYDETRRNLSSIDAIISKHILQ